ncbi:nucleotide exchange factor GrpE [Candidatus Dependentiae bacterium]|nr:nucleotide exchange factor GrpE [Candidatus Dependentiae bacterium]
MINEEKNQNNIENEQKDEVVDQKKNEQAEKESELCQTEISLWKDQCKRISAEFENFKKRTEREQLRWIEMAKEKLLKELLPIVDDFERALKQEKSDQAGIQMMYQAFMKFLQKNGVALMQSYDKFDPELHEAVMQVESSDHVSGYIVEVFSNGFMINDRVLRPAQVSVAK